MKFISHRGYWKNENEKNSAEAFRRSFNLGFGTETDVRDSLGQLVISHDIPSGMELKAEEFFQIYKDSACDYLLALNIKSDGLQKPLSKLLKEYEVDNYFVFDMSVPDGVVYLKEKLKACTRQSEYEKRCSFYENAIGVWMDEFHSDWITNEIIQEHLRNNKQVCIVSPELHGRAPEQKWARYRDLIDIQDTENIIICTDIPEQAKEFIYGKD